MHTAAATSTRVGTFAGFASTRTGKVLLGLAATLVVAAAAHVAIPLPFSPVPLTLQPLAVLGVGLALGPVAGFLTMLAYLAEGAIGLPVFAPTGVGGWLQIIGPTGGYLLAYPLVAAIAGGVTRLLSPRSTRFLAAILGCAAATVVLFLCGAAWLAQIAHLSPAQAWHVAVLPFLPGEAVKIAVASGVYSTLLARSASK
jgi:biotin transport system substrate-specific component